MISERVLSTIIKNLSQQHLELEPTAETHLPEAEPGRKYLLYMHVPFCQRLCPYCSFNRYPFRPEIAAPYFASMRKEMLMLKDLGYDFESVYVGGGTPTIMIDELCETIDLARETFSIKEVSSETNPNHLAPEYLQKMKGRIQRLSVGVQSFDDGLLKQMDRYDKYGSGAEILERIAEATPCFDSLNVDMIYNFPSQTEDILFSDLEKLALCGCTPDHVHAPVRVVGHGAQDSLDAGDGGARPGVPLLPHHRGGARRGRGPAVREPDQLDLRPPRPCGACHPVAAHRRVFERPRGVPRHRQRVGHASERQHLREHVRPARVQRLHCTGPHVGHGQVQGGQARPHALPPDAAAAQPAFGQARVPARLRLHRGGRPACGDGVSPPCRGVRNRRCGRGARSRPRAATWRR